MRTTLALLLSTALPASAADLTLLVDRTKRSVEMFIKFETLETEALLAPLPADFLDAEGLVDIAPFREGTYIYGDELWSDIETVIGGENALVEAMSLMVHPDSLPVDFDDPIDGWIAMAVCNVTDPNARFELGELSTYAGFIAWDVQGHAPLSLTFPREMEVEMTEFLEGREISARTVSVGPDAPLTLDAVTTWERLRFW